MKNLIILGLAAALCFGCDDGGDTDAGPGGSDAGPGGNDAGPGGNDAGPGDNDAGPGGTDAGPGTGDAGPEVDGGPGGGGMHCGGNGVIIQEINVGTSITLFNPTGSPVAASDVILCMRPAYPTAAMLSPTADPIPAGGTSTLSWPSNFTDTDAGGELAIYSSRSFMSPAAVVDFVCWGTGHPGGRQSTAEMGGNWSGACAPAISGSLTREPDTAGNDAASYSSTGGSAALTCP